MMREGIRRSFMLRNLAAFALVASSFAYSPALLACGDAAAPPAAVRADVKTVRERCDGAGEWSIAARGAGLGRFEGKRVWLSAVERDRGGPVVLLEGRIAAGAFAFSCAKTLHTTYAYPTFAVVIDEDGNGRCSPGDVQSARQLYGWKEDQQVTVEAAQLQSVRTASTLVGDRKTFDFCALYFDR